MHTAYSDVMLTIMSSILWAATHAFAVKIQHQLQLKDKIASSPKKICSWPEIRRLYSGLKHLSKLVNEIVGFRLTLYLVKTVLYYAVVFEKISTWQELGRAGMYLCASAIFLVISADIDLQVRK